MLRHIEERVAYGHSICERTACMHEAHGDRAEEMARAASDENGNTVAERNFWRAVANRLARMNAAAAMQAIPPVGLEVASTAGAR
jgi:hypothetical protein